MRFRTDSDILRFTSTVTIALALSLAACGGGGSGSEPDGGAVAAPGGGLTGEPAPPSSPTLGSVGGRLIADSGVGPGGRLLDVVAAAEPLGGVDVRVESPSGERLGQATTGPLGGFEIEGLRPGPVAVVMTFTSELDLDRDGRGDRVTLSIESTVSAGQRTRLDEAVSLVDLDGDGAADAILLSGAVSDSDGERPHLFAHDPATGTSAADTDGDGNVGPADDRFDDANGDGVPDDLGVLNEVELKGTIERLSASEVVVGGVRFQVDDRTLWLDRRGTATTASAFGAGDPVEIKGRRSGGTLFAVRVKSEDDVPGAVEEVELRGTIEALGAARIVVRGVEMVVDGGTQVLDRNNAPISYGDLREGQFVEIEGRRSGGALVATKIKLEDLGGGAGGEVELRGVIDAIGGGSVTVGGQTWEITGSTRFLGRRNQAVDRSLFQAGDYIEIEGFRAGDGHLVAVKLKLEDLGGDDRGRGGDDDDDDRSGPGGGDDDDDDDRSGPGGGDDDDDDDRSGPGGGDDDDDDRSGPGGGDDGDDDHGRGGGDDDDHDDDHGRGGDDDDDDDDHGRGGDDDDDDDRGRGGRDD